MRDRISNRCYKILAQATFTWDIKRPVMEICQASVFTCVYFVSSEDKAAESGVELIIMDLKTVTHAECSPGDLGVNTLVSIVDLSTINVDRHCYYSCYMSQR